jgi:hypothetical protein
VELLWLSLFAFFAGFIDSVAGGGGLIQIPALFLFLPPSASASVASVFGTNKLSSICGTSIAALQYARRVSIPWRSMLPAALTAFVFSFLGARLVTLLRPEYLKPIVVGLLVLVAIYTFINKNLGDLHAPRLPARTERWLAAAAGMAIGFYDGFFGPGTGSFLIFVFIGWFGFDFLTASASAKIVNFATNLSAVAYFAATDHILYRYALPMAACNILGSWLGSRMALLKGNRWIRACFLLVVSALIIRLGYDLLGNR